MARQRRIFLPSVLRQLAGLVAARMRLDHDVGGAVNIGEQLENANVLNQNTLSGQQIIGFYLR